MAINLAHRFVYFVPEAAEEYSSVGVVGRGGYFGVRVAPLGAVPDQVIIATFYNFSPRAIAGANMASVWAAATPEAMQAARFRAAGRAMTRVGAALSDAELAEARAIIDPVVASLDYAGKPLAAANAAVALPDDSQVALWQQVTIVREWRGDAHIAILQAAGLGPCDCTVMQVGTGRFPKGLAAATRLWTEDEWAAAVARLAARGWATEDGALTPVGIEAREQIEADTDRLCSPIWDSVSDEAGARLTALLSPVHHAFLAAGTYAAFS